MTFASPVLLQSALTFYKRVTVRVCTICWIAAYLVGSIQNVEVGYLVVHICKVIVSHF